MSFESLRKKPVRHIVGLMSGTSADGIDAVLCAIEGFGKDCRARILHMSTLDYPESMRGALVGNPWEMNAESVARLSFLLGEMLAEAALKCIREAGFAPVDIDLISSHGQTIAHFPDTNHPLFPVRATLQIGDISVIAKRTGIMTAGDFRPSDMAVGGQGAPLVPYADWILFRDPAKGRIIQNIGGIGNLTYLPPDCDMDSVIAFDTGPGNMMVDMLASIISGGRETMDRDAKMAEAGEVDSKLLDYLLSEPYYSVTPPKSTGRELFGRDYVNRILEFANPANEAQYLSVIRTVSELTVRSMVDSYRAWVFPRGPVHEVIVGGGGALNPYFMRRLREELPGVSVQTHDQAGIPSKAKEALAFAILGNELLGGVPNNIPGATGASRPTIMGKVAFP